MDLMDRGLIGAVLTVRGLIGAVEDRVDLVDRGRDQLNNKGNLIFDTRVLMAGVKQLLHSSLLKYS